jgi:hypothetical protein
VLNGGLRRLAWTLRRVVKKSLRKTPMAAAVVHFVSNRLRPPVAAFLCIASMQLVTLGVASCHGDELPMGAVRVSVTR